MTAVEFLQKMYNDPYNNRPVITVKEFEEAVEMERKQIMNAYNTGYQDRECNHINDADNYINEIYL